MGLYEPRKNKIAYRSIYLINKYVDWSTVSISQMAIRGAEIQIAPCVAKGKDLEGTLSHLQTLVQGQPLIISPITEKINTNGIIEWPS